MSLRRTALWVLVATAALVMTLLFTGAASGWVVLAYVLFVAAALLAFLIDRLRAVLPLAADFEAILKETGRTKKPPDHFEAFKRRLAVASSTQADVQSRLRLRVRRIASARLSCLHGIDLEHEPERAADLMRGSRTWELIRPDRVPPRDDLARGRPELEQLIDELESL